MADVSDGPTVFELDLHETRKRLEVVDKKYRNLKGLSQRAVVEFEELQKTCQEYFEKYKEQEAKYVKVKGDLEKLKDVSNLALSEYENLHSKFEVEQSCRNKAEEFATNMVQENKKLKRQSQLLISQVGGQVNLEELSSADVFKPTDDQSLSDNAVLHEEIKGLKGLVESLKNEVKRTKEELTATQNRLNKENYSHEATRKRLLANEKQFKQLNRVSVLALEEYSSLQQKYALETQCRFEAEKYAAEVLREKDVLDQQKKYISETTSKDEQLKKALEEISALNKKLAEERTDYEEKIKDLLEDIKASKDEGYIKVTEEKLQLAQDTIESLELQLSDSEKNLTNANQKVSELEKSLEEAQKQAAAPPPPPPAAAPPPPPPLPPPPPPTQLIKKFMNIVGAKKKKDSLKRNKGPKDPMSNAMAEMMERIKNGNIGLKPVRSPSSGSNESDETDAMSDLGNFLKTLKKHPSIEIGPGATSPTDEPGAEWTNIKLRKMGTSIDSKETSAGSNNSELSKVVLRKPRSRSAGDILDEKPKDEATTELKRILERQKAAAEKEKPEEKDGNVCENGSR